MKQSGTREPHSAPLRFQFATALCQNVANPLGLAPVREGDDDVVATPKDQHRSVVLAMRFTSGVHNDAHARQTPRHGAEKEGAASAQARTHALQSPLRIAGALFKGEGGVPLGMSRIHSECADSDPPDRLVPDVLLRQEPDEEEDEEEDDGYSE